MKAADIKVGMRFDSRTMGKVVVEVIPEFDKNSYRVYKVTTRELSHVASVPGNLEVGTPINMAAYVTPLTPAQKHADELLALAHCATRNSLPGPVREAAWAVISKIEPKPVTLDEAMALLAKIHTGTAQELVARYEATKCA